MALARRASFQLPARVYLVWLARAACPAGFRVARAREDRLSSTTVMMGKWRFMTYEFMGLDGELGEDDF